MEEGISIAKACCQVALQQINFENITHSIKFLPLL